MTDLNIIQHNLKLHRFVDRKARTDNTGFASGGVTCKLGALCFYSSSVLVDSCVLRNPPERKARKRYLQPYCDSAIIKQTT